MQCDAAGRTIVSTNPLNEVTTTVYDAAGRSIASVDPLGLRTSTSYDAAGRNIATENALNEVTTSVYDAAGQTIASVDPLGQRTTTSYDAAGRSVASTNPAGETTTTVYDAAGQSIASIDPLNQRTTTAYDAAGRSVATTDPLHNTATTVYDAAGRGVASIDPLGRRATTSYDDAGRTVASTNPLNETVSTVYDAAGRSIVSIDPLSQRSTTVYDAAGRSVASTNPLDETTTTVYDGAGRSIASVDPLGHRTTTNYDAADRPVAVVDGNGNRTTTVYDAAGRDTARVNALGFRTTHIYDAASRRIVLLDANNGRTTFDYDPAGRQTAIVNPLGDIVTTAYDAAGRESLTINARNQRTTTSYDAAGRPSVQLFAEGNRLTWTYDDAGNPLTIQDASGIYTRTFDPLNQIRTLVNPDGGKFTWTFDAAGRQTLLVDPESGRTSYSYDAAGRLTRLHNPQDEKTTLAYDAAGRETRKDLANGTRTSSTYDAAGRLLEVFDLASDGSVISGFQYADDAAGNRTSAVDADDNRTTWTYDDTYQLLTEFRTGTEPYRHTYTYDAVGNRTRKEATETTDYDYDAANRLLVERTSLDRTTYTWDADGNQTGIEDPTGELTTNTWSSGSQIVRVERADGAVTTFTYGPVTRRAEYKRLSREDDAGTLVNRWDSDNIVQQTDDLGNVEAEYTLAPEPQGNLVSQQRSAESRFYHYDGRTNTSKLTDAAEVVTDELVLDAWGNVIFETAGTVENPFALMGQKLVFREDAMGSGKPSLWARQRWLDPAAGRWRSEDPIRDDESNLYRYARNNAVNAIDPSGLIGICERPGAVGRTSLRASEPPCSRGPSKYLGTRLDGSPQDQVIYRVPSGGKAVPMCVPFDRLKEAIDSGELRIDFSSPSQSLSGLEKFVTGMDKVQTRWFGQEVMEWYAKQTGCPLDAMPDPRFAAFCTLIAKILNISQFCPTIENLQGAVPAMKQADEEDRLDALFNDVGAGWNQGVDRFQGNIQGNIKDVIGDFLGIDPGVFTFDFTKAGLFDYVKLAGMVVNVQPKDVLGELRSQLGDELVDAATFVFEKIEQGRTDIAEELKTAARSHLQQLKSEGERMVSDGLAKAAAKVVGPMLLNLAKRLAPGAGWIKLARDLYHFVKAILKVIVDLLGTLAEAVVTAGKAVGQVVTTIAGKVFDFIKRAILKLLCVFTNKILPALGKAARAVGDFFKEAGRKIWGLIRWVICKLAKVWGRLVAKFSRKGKTGKQGAGACAIRPPQGGCKKTDRQRPSRTRSGRKSKCASCFVAGTMVEAVPFKRAIELLVWDWVKTLLARDRRPLPQPAQPPIGTSHLREVSLRMDRPDGSCTTADLLRTEQWFADQDIFVGNTIYIELPHMSLQGEARVTRINRSPEISPPPADASGEYRLVTGRFCHTSGEVYDLKLASESQPIGVTATHPFWSCDRNAWISAIDLEIGETLKTLEGTTVVESRSKREEPETVYNIEVEGDHVYRVGESGVLVHNASPNYMGTTTVNVTWYNQQIVRSEGASFVVTDATLGTGTAFQRAIHLPAWWDALTTQFPNGDWQRGHLIGNQLGGPGGTEWRNMVPLHRRANDPGMQECEERVKERAECGESVNLVVTPTYRNRQVVPLWIHMTATNVGTNEVLFDVNVPNQLGANAPAACTS